MKANTYVPDSARIAGGHIRRALARPLESLPSDEFVRAWSSVAYLFPGLHPDSFENPESGWPRALRRFGAEAWKRAEAGELADDELYACEAQWAGIYDRLDILDPASIERREALTRQRDNRPTGR